MSFEAARARLLEAQRLLLDAQEELARYQGESSPGACAVADDDMRDAMREIGRAREEVRAALAAPQPEPAAAAPGTF